MNQYESVEKEQTVEKTVTYSRDDLSSTEDSKDVEEELVNQYEETKESSGEIEQTVTYSRDDLVEATESKSGRITSPQVIDEQLYLPAEMVLELLNENDLVEPKDALLSKDLDFILEKQDILDGLKVGRISLSLRQVQSRFTSLVLNDTALDGASIQVPLAKFMVVIPKEWYMLSKKQDESKTKIVDGMSDLFTKEGIAAAAAEAKEEIKT